MRNINQELDNLWQAYSSEPKNMGTNNSMRKEAARSLCGMMNREVDFSNILGDYVTKENIIDALRRNN